MPRAQTLAGQEGREQNDQERPEIDDEEGIDGGQAAHGEEIDEMVAEQGAYREKPGRPSAKQAASGPRIANCSPSPTPPPTRKAMPVSRNGDTGTQHRQRSQERPEKDGSQPDDRPRRRSSRAGTVSVNRIPSLATRQRVH